MMGVNNMASPLQDLVAYWNADTTLSTIPLWKIIAPPTQCLPYATVVPANPGLSPLWATGGQSIERFKYTINYYSATSTDAENTGTIIACRLDFATILQSECLQGPIGIGTTCYMSNIRENGPLLVGQVSTLKDVWLEVLVYILQESRFACDIN